MTDDIQHHDAEGQGGAGHARGLRTQADADRLAVAGTSREVVTARAAGQPTGIADRSRLPTLITVAGERASVRFLEFFASTLRNPHTRRAYM